MTDTAVPTFSVDLSAFPIFLASGPEPPVPWPIWGKSFTNTLHATSADTFPDSRKISILIHSLGDEGRRIWYSICDNANCAIFDAVLQQLQTHFLLKVIAAQFRFCQRCHLPGESIDQFYTALRQLVKDCEFGAMESEMLSDQIVEKVHTHRIQERLLTDPKLTLTTALDTCRAMEKASTMAQSMSASAKSVSENASATVLKVMPQKKFVKKSGTKNCTGPRKGHCFHCDSTEHYANDANCPAKNSSCNICKKTGHFSKICRNSTLANASVKNVKTNDSSEEDNHVLSISTSDRPSYMYCIMNLHMPTDSVQAYKMLIDTGSPVSMLHHSVYAAHFSAIPLRKPTTQLRNFDGGVINGVRGCITAKVSYKDRTTDAEFFVVDDNNSALMGLNLIHALSVDIHGQSLTVHSVTLDSVHAEFPVLFSDKLGCAKKFFHEIHLHPDAKPVAYKLHPVPFSLHDKVSAELRKMQDDGIIEPIDASDWVNPLHYVAKKDNKVRIVCDLRALNEFVVADRYPLPNIQDLYTELQGATVFSKLDMRSAYFHM